MARGGNARQATIVFRGAVRRRFRCSHFQQLLLFFPRLLDYLQDRSMMRGTCINYRNYEDSLVSKGSKALPRMHNEIPSSTEAVASLVAAGT